MTNAAAVSRHLSKRGFVSSTSEVEDDGAGRFRAIDDPGGQVFVFPADPMLALMLVEVLREDGYDADRIAGSYVLSVSGSPRRADR